MRRPKHLPNYTVQDYRSWQGDWELIDGIPWALYSSSGGLLQSPVRVHQRLVILLIFQIQTFLRDNKNKYAGCNVIQSLDWIIDNSNVTRPDIAITHNDNNDFITSPPALIIEILSPSTVMKDKRIKFEIYEEQKVKYYIIVNPDTKTYTIYSLKDNHYIKQNKLKSFLIHDNCPIDLDIDKALSELETE